MFRQILLISGVILSQFCSNSLKNETPLNNSTNEQKQTPYVLRSIEPTDLTSFGIKLECECKIEGSIVPGVVLEDPDDKPDSVTSNYLSIVLVDETWHNEEGERSEIKVYKIDDLRSAYSKSESNVRAFDERLSDLEKTLHQDAKANISIVPQLRYSEIPYIFEARRSTVHFEDGTGVAYIYQSEWDPFIISDKGIHYRFQGLTTNKKFYFVAEFPVLETALSKIALRAKSSGYELPDFKQFYENAEAREEYRKYQGTIRSYFEDDDNAELTGYLNRIDAILSSIAINDETLLTNNLTKVKH